MIRKINKWWMGLDPSYQYLYWIISFCLMIGSLVSGLVWLPPVSTPWYMFDFIAVGIFGLVGFFMFVVVFLAVFWPHAYREGDDDES